MDPVRTLLDRPLDEAELAALTDRLALGGDPGIAADVTAVLQQHAILADVARAVASEISVFIFSLSLISQFPRYVAAFRSRAVIHALRHRKRPT